MLRLGGAMTTLELDRFTNPMGLTFVRIPAGTFRMVSTLRPEEQPVHTVDIRSFWMGGTEVTQVQWQVVMGTNPSHFKEAGPDAPVEQVTWENVQVFLRRLTEKDPGWNPT